MQKELVIRNMELQFNADESEAQSGSNNETAQYYDNVTANNTSTETETFLNK